MDRATALTKIDTKYHAVADALAAQAVDWNAIVALLTQLLPLILSIFSKPQPAQASGFTCPNDAVVALDESQKAILAALAANVCAKHCLCCP